MESEDTFYSLGLYPELQEDVHVAQWEATCCSELHSSDMGMFWNMEAALTVADRVPTTRTHKASQASGSPHAPPYSRSHSVTVSLLSAYAVPWLLFQITPVLLPFLQWLK